MGAAIAQEASMFLGLSGWTLIHTLLSLVGLLSGVIVVLGILASNRSRGWTTIFLLTAIATSATGFILPAERFGASHWTGVIALAVLALALVARYLGWLRTYAVGLVLTLYFLVFVGVAQLFSKVPALHALAPTQSEPPFAIAEIAVLVLFIVLAIVAALKSRAAATA
jgi:hypothetical protein